MSTKKLLVIGSLWFAAVVLWLFFGRTSVSIAWSVKGTKTKIAGTAVLYAIAASYILFLTGWVLPIGVGIYRLVHEH